MIPRFRKSKLPTDISVPTPTPPPELVRNLTSRRSSRTLAISSTAIALSIGSAFHNPRETSGDGAAVRGRDTGWQMAYGAARMAVEMAKESSDMFLPLKAVVGAMSVLIKNYDQTSNNAETVKEIEKRVQSLSGVLASPTSEEDYAEKGRRLELQRKLQGVITKLEPLADQNALIGFLRNVDNVKVLTGFVQELSDAITDYQVSVHQAVYQRTRNIYNDTNNIREVADLEFLEKLKPVHNAGFQAGHHDKCLPGTRESVLQAIVIWANNLQDQNVFWLNGLAGTGKSTIAQSFSEIIVEEGILGASFFCSRDYLDRKELKNIFPTLAYQLACRYPQFRTHLVATLKKDPTLAHTSLISQLENLLVNPFSREKLSCVIVIDALDECTDDQPASAVLSVLGRFVKRLPLVKFFITGRPEPRIRTGFRLPLLQPFTQIFLLHEVGSASVDNDIRLYLTQRLTTIAKQRSDLDLPNPWPCDSELTALTKKSSGLFIFASTLVRFIESEHHEPKNRLQLVLSKGNNTAYEGRAGIDSLYSQILAHAFSDVREPEVFADMRRILGSIILAFNPLSRRDLSMILCTPTVLISTTLRHLHSVLLVPADESEKIRVFHKSFPDFLQDRERCTDSRFHINPTAHHGDMVLSCLELVKELERDPCSLPPFTMNQDAIDLPQLLENKLGGAVRYACRYWARHIGLSPTSGNHINRATLSTSNMLKNAPPWIEVMSLEGRLEDVIRSMYGLIDWLNEVRAGVRAEVYNKAYPEAYASAYARANAVKSWLRPEANVGARADAIAHTEAKTRAEAHAEAVAHAEAKADARAKLLTAPLDDLATDCLRLSMHFFHPIQQCAQQLYHTALPLSPTSSLLRKFCLQNVVDNQLSHVATFSGASSAWGLLLMTVDTRPRRLSCITTSVQGIIAACGDIVNIYDAITFILRQSLHAPEVVTKIRDSPDGSTLFLAHLSSVTMWDVQTGGRIHTFTASSEIRDMAVSTMGDHIACGLSGSTVTSWNIHNKEGKGFKVGQPVVTIFWLSHRVVVVATQGTIHTHDIVIGKTTDKLPIPGRIWGMVYLEDRDEFLVGVSRQISGTWGEECFFVTIKYAQMHRPGLQGRKPLSILRQSPVKNGYLSSPVVIGGEIVCMIPGGGVQSFNTRSRKWTEMPPFLGAALSVAVSLNRNLVVQTRDLIQIFSADILTSNEAHDDVRSSHVYPLGETYIICVLQPGGHFTLLELETLGEVRPDDNTSPLGSLTQSQRLGTLLSELGRAGEGAPLGLLSPMFTWVVTVRGSPRRRLCVGSAAHGTTIADKILMDDESRAWEVYGIAFDSENRFYLKIDGPGRHVQIPCDIVPSPEGRQHRIIIGDPEPLSQPRETPPYTLDKNCEWILDSKSRKICWISPGHMRRGNGGHFWAGLSLVMVGDDGVVKKLTFKDPDFCTIHT